MRIIKIVEGIVDGRGIIKVAIVAEHTLILNVERTMTSAMTKSGTTSVMTKRRRTSVMTKRRKTSAMTKRRMTSAMIKTMRLY